MSFRDKFDLITLDLDHRCLPKFVSLANEVKVGVLDNDHLLHQLEQIEQVFFDIIHNGICLINYYFVFCTPDGCRLSL